MKYLKRIASWMMGLNMLFYGQFVYATLDQHIIIHHPLDYGYHLVGSAHMEFSSQTQPLGITWDGTQVASLAADTGSPFGFTGNWVTTAALNAWKQNTPTQVTMAARITSNSPEIGLFFAPTSPGYFKAINLMDAQGVGGGTKQLKVEGFGVADNLTTPALNLILSVEVNNQNHCQNDDFCELELASSDIVTFTLVPTVNTQIHSLPSLAVMPDESDMTLQTVNVSNPSSFLQSIRYVKVIADMQGSSTAVCSRQQAGFQTQLLTVQDSINQNSYFQDLSANSTAAEGCIGYSFLMSPRKSLQLQSKPVNGTGQSDYVDYMFYFPGHFNPNSPQRDQYPGSHKTIRLRAPSGNGSTNYSASFGLSGSASAPYSTTVNASTTGFTPQSYQWSGNGIQISNPTAQSTPITISTPGSYTLSLTVSGANGEFVSAQRSIQISDGNTTPGTTDPTTSKTPPVAKIMLGDSQLVTTQAYSASAGQTLNFNAIASDSDGTISRYLWDVTEKIIFVNIPTQKATIHSPNTQNTQITFHDGGEFTVQLTVFDNDDLFGNAQGLVKVGGSGSVPTTQQPTTNQVPVAEFSLNTNEGTVGLAVSANGSASKDPDGSINSYVWTVSPMTGVAIANPAAIQTDISFNQPGTYKVSLQVTDNNGKSDLSSEQTVTVNLAPVPVAKCTATPQAVLTGETVQLSALNSQQASADAVLTEFNWQSNQGEFILPNGTRLTGTVNAPTTTIIFTEPGEVNISLTVTDSAGKQSSASCPVTVTQAEIPVPTAKCTATPLTVITGQTVQLSALNSSQATSDAALNEFNWQSDQGEFILPNGTRSTGSASSPQLTIIFAESGRKEISLVVKDSTGNSSVPDVCSVTVSQSDLDVYQYSFLDENIVPASNPNVKIRGDVLKFSDGRIERMGQNEASIPQGTHIDLRMELEVDAAHVGTPGEILVIVYAAIGDFSGWFNLDPIYGLTAWDLGLMPPFRLPYYRYAELPSVQQIPVFSGILPVGDYQVYVGYTQVGSVQGNMIYFSGKTFQVR